MSEREVAAVIEAELRRVGFDKPAFDTIVAAGPNSAVPHYRAGDRQLAAGDLVILDFGGMLRGYAVDMTRTIVVGGAGRARAAAAGAGGRGAAGGVRCDRASGAPATDVDRAARDVLERARTGRGVQPRHGARAGSRSARTAPARATSAGVADRAAASRHGVHARTRCIFPGLGRCANRR